jgi:hypothetical protein
MSGELNFEAMPFEAYETVAPEADFEFDQEFTGPEHCAIGNLAAAGEQTPEGIAYGERGERLSFGEVVALAGDYFGDLRDMFVLARTPNGRAQIAWARWDALLLPEKQKPRVPKEKEVKAAVLQKKYLLASRNLSHFSAGGTAWETYLYWHRQAIILAFLASKKAWQGALLYEAFADHFLTDMFSAGHVRMPRAAIRAWYQQQMPGSIDRFIRYMAKFIYDQFDVPFPVNLAPDKIKKEMEKSIRKLGGEAVNTFSLGDIVSLALHDFDGHGLRVVSDVNPVGRRVRGGYRWCAVGDSHLGHLTPVLPKTIQSAYRTCAASDHSKAADTTKSMAVAAVKLKRFRDAGRKSPILRSVDPWVPPKIVKQILGDPAIFAAKAFVPREDRAPGANIPLPGTGGGASPLEWRWGQLGNAAYQMIDVTVKQTIANELGNRLRDLPDSISAALGLVKFEGLRAAFGSFVNHLRAKGIQALEMAVRQKAR